MAAKPARGQDGVAGLNGRDGRDSRPVPDPTVRTDQLVSEAVGALRELLEARVDGQRAVFEARLNGNEEAVKLLQTILDRQPADVDGKVQNLERLHNEKFSTVNVQFESVQTQFAEREVRGRDAALANTTAVNAALQAQKEAAGEQAKSFTLSIDKSEKGTLEQIAQQRVLLETMKQTLDGKVEDVKERLTRIESIAVGMTSAKTEGVVSQTMDRGGNTFALQMVMGLVTVIAVVISIVMALRG